MRCYTIGTGVVEGIRLNKNRQIELGEEGRGRKLIKIPLPEIHITKTTLQSGMTVERVVEMGGPSESAVLVRIPDMSGYRGTWELLDATTPETTKLIEKITTEFPDWGSWGYIGEIEKLKREAIQASKVKTIAEGYCAQGDAGRMGGGPDVLLRLEKGQELLIIRFGRLYGEPPEILIKLEENNVPKVIHLRKEAKQKAALNNLKAALENP